MLHFSSRIGRCGGNVLPDLVQCRVLSDVERPQGSSIEMGENIPNELSNICSILWITVIDIGRRTRQVLVVEDDLAARLEAGSTVDIQSDGMVARVVTEASRISGTLEAGHRSVGMSNSRPEHACLGCERVRPRSITDVHLSV